MRIYKITFKEPINGQLEIINSGPNWYYKSHFNKKYNGNIKSVRKLTFEDMWHLYADFIMQLSKTVQRNLSLETDNEQLKEEIESLKELLYRSGHSILQNKIKNSKEYLTEEIERIVNADKK